MEILANLSNEKRLGAIAGAAASVETREQKAVCTRVRRVKLIKNTITKTAHHLSYETQQRIIAEFQHGTKFGSRSNTKKLRKLIH